MALEIFLRPPFTVPRVLQARKKEQSPRAHWIGQASGINQGNENQEPQKNDFQGGENEPGNNPLSIISLSDVDDAIKAFKYQLKPVGENWIGINHFCTLPLIDKGDDRPPVIFGRVKTAFPSDGHLENIEQLVLQFPSPGTTPQLLSIHKDDISLYSTIHAQSFYIRVQVKAFEEGMAEFERSDQLFAMHGFIPEFDPEYYDLLDMNEQNQSEYPWLYVIDSRWFSSIPESLYIETVSKLREMLGWGKIIINYHPGWFPKDIRSLNRALGLKYKLSKYYLTEPNNPKETAELVETLFKERFDQGLFR